MSENLGGPGGPAATNQPQPPPYADQSNGGSNTGPQPGQSHTGQPNPGHATPGQSNIFQGKNFFDWIRGLHIVRGQDRWFGGVASGIAHRLGIDPIIVRGIIVVSSIFFGIGLLAYGIAWALLPEPDGRIHVQEVAKGHWSSGMTGAAIFIGLSIIPAFRGIFGFVFGFGFGGNGWFPWPLLWLAGIAGLIIWAVNANKSGRPGRPNPPAGHHGRSNPGANPSAKPYPAPYRPASEQRFSAPTQAYETFAPAPEATAPVFYPQPIPPRPIRHSFGPGAAMVGATLGLAALVAGGVFLAELLGYLNGSVAVVAWASAAAVCGLGIVVAALRGRSSGALGFFAVVGIIVAAFFAVLPSNSNWVFARSVTWTAQSVADTGSGYSIAAASGRIDLEQLGSISSDATVPVVVNAGSATIKVPSNIRVLVKNQMWLPSTSINGQKTSDSRSNLDVNGATTGPVLTLQLQGTVGDVFITSSGTK